MVDYLVANTVNIEAAENKMPDLILAIAHHLAVFSLVALFAAEFALLRPGLEGRRLEQLGAIDRAYGGVAGLVIVIGIIRVIFGTAGWDFYVGNWAFWLKMAAFLAMGLLSIKPTMDILRWRKAAAGNAGYTPPEAEIRASRTFVHAQAGALLLIPTFAALIPRIYGI
jgi:putative membrane protein